MILKPATTRTQLNSTQFSWNADAHQRPSFRHLCEAFRSKSVSLGDFDEVILPPLPTEDVSAASPPSPTGGGVAVHHQESGKSKRDDSGRSKNNKGLLKAIGNLREKEQSQRLREDSERALQIIQQGVSEAKMKRGRGSRASNAGIANNNNNSSSSNNNSSSSSLGKKKDSKSSFTKSTSLTSTSVLEILSDTDQEPEAMELKPVCTYLDLMGEVSKNVKYFLCLTLAIIVKK